MIMNMPPIQPWITCRRGLNGAMNPRTKAAAALSAVTIRKMKEILTDGDFFG